MLYQTWWDIYKLLKFYLIELINPPTKITVSSFNNKRLGNDVGIILDDSLVEQIENLRNYSHISGEE